MAAQDFIWEVKNDGVDVVIENGDFKVGESGQQHITDILIGDKGQFRQFPLVGVGIEKTVNGPNLDRATKREIRDQLESDIFVVNKIVQDGANYAVDATEKIVL